SALPAHPLHDALPIWFDNKTPDDWLATYNNNAVAALRLIHLLSPAMKERGWGRIIQIASAAASAPSETVPQYSASKAAIVNLTRSEEHTSELQSRENL